MSSKQERHYKYQQLTKKGQFFTIEYSSSNRAKCKGCKRNIDKKEIRVRHVNCNVRCCRPSKNGVSDVCGRWHLKCLLDTQGESIERFLHSNPEFKAITKSSQFDGFDKLDSKDQEYVNSLL